MNLVFHSIPLLVTAYLLFRYARYRGKRTARFLVVFIPLSVLTSLDWVRPSLPLQLFFNVLWLLPVGVEIQLGMGLFFLVVVVPAVIYRLLIHDDLKRLLEKQREHH